jgi:hypothetical protein
MFVMKRVEDLEHSMASPSTKDAAARQRDSTFGVQSLADTLEAAFGSEHAPLGKEADKVGNKGKQKAASSRAGSHGSSTGSVTLPDGTKTTPVRMLKRNFSNHAGGAPAPAPFALPTSDVLSSFPTSAMSSTPRSASTNSLKLSDEESAMEDVASQAVASSGDEEEHVETQAGASSFPQLVMPSIQMPTRRPFTTRGKAMGKLKLMVAGGRGA